VRNVTRTSSIDLARRYYRLAPAYNVQNWVHSKDRLHPDVPPARKKSIDEHNTAVDQEVARISADISAMRKKVELKLLDAKLAVLPDSDKSAARTALGTQADQRNAEQTTVAAKFAHLAVTPEEIDKSLDPAAKKQCDELSRRAADAKSSKQTYGMIQAMWDVGTPPPNHLMRRGDFKSPGAAVEPGVIQILDDPQHPFRLPESSKNETTGYRTAFARWLTRPNHPTARVIVSRVWQQRPRQDRLHELRAVAASFCMASCSLLAANKRVWT
jgi:hypothetical protein